MDFQVTINSPAILSALHHLPPHQIRMDFRGSEFVLFFCRSASPFDGFDEVNVGAHLGNTVVPIGFMLD